MNTSADAVYLPQTDRLGLLHRGISVLLLGALTICLSVFILDATPKLSVIVAAVCIATGGKRLLSSATWPLFAILLYDLFLALFFPGARPETSVIFEHPLINLDCMLLTALALGGQTPRRQHILMLGVLFISLIGVVGDLLGHEMIFLLPLKMPDDPSFDQVTMIGDMNRVRGFFAESGVLGAVSLGFATMMGIGALVLIRFRASLRYAWAALLGTMFMGGAIFCLTITKSGLVMLVAGFAGFIAVLISARNPRCRGYGVVALAALLIGGTGFLVAGPPSLTGYLRGEITAVLHPDEMGAAMAASHSGMITRYKCWQLAFASLRDYPLGVGPYGLGSVVEKTGDAGFTQEMRLFFSHDIFGLKNAFANLIAECGIVGLGLLFFWLWACFIQPARRYLADGSGRNALIAGLYGASGLSCLVFLFSCELYPSLAFLLVLKFHADAVAHACTSAPEPGFEALELIG